MTTSGVTPSNLRDTSNTIEGGKIATKSLAHKPIVLSLEVVKNIWRSYPTLPDTKKLASARVPPSSPQSSNALELNLGQQTVNEIHSGSPSISMSHPKPDNQTTGGIDNDFGTPAAPSGQAGSPASERAVDDLLPTVPDSMDVSPSANNKPLSSFRAPPSPLNQTQQDRSRLPLSSGSGKLQPGSGSHSMLDVRSTLLESMSKVAHLRNPNTAVDYEKLTNRFATKLSDSEMRDIMQIGKEVIDQLRRSGKMEDVKRKYTSDNDENTQRRTRRRLESPVPGPSVTAQDDLKKYQSAQDSGNTTRTTSNIANNLNHIPPPGAPRAPRAMLSNDWRDIPPRVPPSLPHMAPRYSTPPPQRDGISLEPLSPGQILEDEPMSVSTAPSAPLSPQSIRTSSALPVTTSITINRLEPPHKNASGDAAEAKNDTEAMATPLEDNPLQDPSTTRILLAKIGNPSAGLLNASFDLDNQLVTAIRRWTERSKQFNPNEPSLGLYLISIPTSAAEKAYKELPPDSHPSFLAETVSKISVVWPQAGTLYISLNTDRPEAVSYADNFFGPSSPALDLSSVVVQGTNNIQFVQLGDHSQTLFVVLAIPPSEAEKQEAAHKSKTHVKLQFDASRSPKEKAI